MSNSEEEEIARDYICFEKPDVTVIVVDATCLERNLNLVYQTMEITDNIIVCVNLLDEAKSKGINIDLDKLSSLLGCPVVGTIAKKKKTLKIPCNEWVLLLLYYGAVNTALSYDTRGCDTPGCTATQSVLVFLRS